MTAVESQATRVSSRRAVADVAVQIGGQGVNLALGIVTTVVIVRSLGTLRYGEWATILATIELVALVGNLGLETVAIRFAAQDPAREGAWIAAATTLRLLISIPVLLAFAVVLALIASDSEMMLAGLILSVLYFTSAISTLRIVFRLQIRNHVAVAVGLAQSVLWAAGVIVVAATGGGLIPFSLAFVAIAIVTQGALAILALRAMPIPWRNASRLWRKLAALGISIGIAGTLTFAYGRVDQLLVYELTPHPSEVGVYAAMYKILENACFVPTALITTLFPILAGLYPGQAERLRRILQAAVDYLLIIAFGALALTLAAASPIVELLFGSEYASGADILPVLMAAFVPICIGSVAGVMVAATDLQRKYIWFALLGLLVNVVLNLILIPSSGITAAAWVTLATELVVVSLSMRAVLVKVGMRLAWRRIATAAIAAAIAGVAVWVLREAGLGAVPLLLVMAAAYPVLLLSVRALDLDELRLLIRSRRESA